ncbi:MAG: ABC transporter permease [Anaerolineae bacterium]
MTRFLGRRLIQMLITFLIFQALLYFLLELQPGDFADQFYGNPNITPAARQVLVEDYGLDRPPVERFFLYIFNFWRGNLGISWSEFPRPVGEIIAERLPRTVFLFLSATLVSFWLGFVSGKVLAWNRDTVGEYVATVLGVGLYTVFTPWFALMMILIFGATLGIFPLGKFLNVREWLALGRAYTANQVFGTIILTATLLVAAIIAIGIVTRKMAPVQRNKIRLPGYAAAVGLFLIYWLVIQGPIAGGQDPMLPYARQITWHLILPVLTVTLISYAGTMLLMRNSMLETLSEDYIETAKAKGLPETMIRDKHAARNALLPVVTSLVYGIAFAINGGIVTETIFSWPGLGLTILGAAQEQDIPLAMGTLLIIGGVALVAHLVADILYAYLDPRIRY